MLLSLDASIAQATGTCWIATAFGFSRKFLHSNY